MRRNTEVKLSLRFDPQRVDDLVSKLSFQVFVNTTSALLEGTKHSTLLGVNVIKRAKISISGYVFILEFRWFELNDYFGENHCKSFLSWRKSYVPITVSSNYGIWEAFIDFLKV